MPRFGDANAPIGAEHSKRVIDRFEFDYASPDKQCCLLARVYLRGDSENVVTFTSLPISEQPSGETVYIKFRKRTTAQQSSEGASR